MLAESLLESKGIPRLTSYPGPFTGMIQSCKDFEGTEYMDRIFFVVDMPKIKATINDMRNLLHSGTFIAGIYHLLNVCIYFILFISNKHHPT
jgi:hypothetical protein